MKTLDRVQKLSKAFYYVSKIMFFVCLAFLAAFAVFAAALLIFKGKLEDNEFELLIKLFYLEKADTPYKGVLAFALSEIVLFVFRSLFAVIASGFFKWELADGSPFTKKTSASFRRLGVFSIFFALAANIIVWFIRIPFGLGFVFTAEAGILVGLAIVFSSAVFLYGAELEKNAGLDKVREESRNAFKILLSENRKIRKQEKAEYRAEKKKEKKESAERRALERAEAKAEERDAEARRIKEEAEARAKEIEDSKPENIFKEEPEEASDTEVNSELPDTKSK